MRAVWAKAEAWKDGAGAEGPCPGHGTPLRRATSNTAPGSWRIADQAAALAVRARTANEAALGESQHRRNTDSARLPGSLTDHPIRDKVTR
jgi:hypothetical protein